MSYGLLGGSAVSVSYRYHGATETVPVEAGTGAYVVVLPGHEPGVPPTIQSGGSFGGIERGGRLAGPDGVISSITYREGGGTCVEVAGRDGPGECPEPHPRLRGSLLSPTVDLGRALRVSFRAGGDVERGATVSFLAPYGVGNALSSYLVAIPTPCHRGTTFAPVDRDVRAGSRVRVGLGDVFANACGAASVEIEVLYAPHGAPEGLPSGGTVLVGKTVVRRDTSPGRRRGR